MVVVTHKLSAAGWEMLRFQHDRKPTRQAQEIFICRGIELASVTSFSLLNRRVHRKAFDLEVSAY